MELTPQNAELIIGIVAPIGVDTKLIFKTIHDQLEDYGYKTHEIHVTNSLTAFGGKLDLNRSSTESRYRTYIAACNQMRRDLGSDIMAILAISEINRIRSADGEANLFPRKAYVISQIKRPEEFDLLRKVYGEHYVQISCYADEKKRIEILTKKIQDDHPESPKSKEWKITAEQLVNTDESEEIEDQGQRVQKVFPLSDVIVHANSHNSVHQGMERFLRVLFGDNSVTPTKEEYGMELAGTASQRSSDLSRQVGAAILSRNMEIKALGCNEVPKASGGTYWEGDDNDGRDFTKGEDTNHKRRAAVLLDLVLRLQSIGALKADYCNKEAIYTLLFDRQDNKISDSQLMDSLEYGRTVHAEMNAITDAARVGHAIGNCVLFSNTFPCHNCTKHIVASGLSEVVYIHPYPKSYAEELFDDSIEINPPRKTTDRKVIFRQFIGIVGPMYSRVFTKARWKQEARGKIKEFKKMEATFIRRTPIPNYLGTERVLLGTLNDNLKLKGYTSTLLQGDLLRNRDD